MYLNDMVIFTAPPDIDLTTDVHEWPAVDHWLNPSLWTDQDLGKSQKVAWAWVSQQALPL